MEISAKTKAMFQDSVVVDMTAPGSPLALLTPTEQTTEKWISDYEKAGITWVSFTVAADHFAQTVETCIDSIAKARHWFLSRPERFVFVEKAEDVRSAKALGKMAVNLHFQGTLPFQRDARLVEVYKKLGVHHALMSYNNKNLVGDGCHERTDSGLSQFGLELIAEMNRVGMIVDVSHTGYRTSMEAIEASSAPVIMSHSSPREVYDHERNVPDDQIVALAKTGGVMGIHGVGIFMSDDGLDVSARRVTDFIQHAVDLVGPAHIGFGLDYIENVPLLQASVPQAGSKYKEGGGYFNEVIRFSPPEVVLEIAELLLQQNYSETDVRGILGDNWLRLFEKVVG